MLEVACFDIESCVIAQKAGAHRIEFCIDRANGGYTPSFQDIAKARQQINIPLHVMIRFKKNDAKAMEEAIFFCKKFKIDGVVFGILKEKEIDILACVKLVELARPMKCTFHRYIDQSHDINKSVEQLIDIGFDNVLTSGGKESALEGAETIAYLQQKYGTEINIIPAGGIRADNIEAIKQKTKCSVFHSAAMNSNSIHTEESIVKKLVHAINS